MDRIVTRTLSCGMALLVERMSGVKSVGLAWNVPAGSAHDPADRVGISAMWAELLLRGAGELDSRAHADALDKLGVSRGTHVETFALGVSATLLGSRLADALPLIVDMVRRPRMDERQIEPVRDLCLQAIESLKDDPQERVQVMLKERHAPAPINRSSLGTVEGISAVKADELRELWEARAKPGGSVMALAGDVDADAAAKQLERLLAGWSGAGERLTWDEGTAPRGYVHETDQTNQVHIAVAHDGPAEKDEGSWPERVATAVLSGGMSGRLFTEVREKRGLCYSVYASYGTDATFGRTVAYVGTTPERAQESLDVLMGEIMRLRTEEGRVTPEEFQRAVVGMKSKLVTSGESSGARAAALVRDYHRLGRGRSLEEMTARIDALKVEDVNRHLRGSSLGRMTIATIGPQALKVKRET